MASQQIWTGKIINTKISLWNREIGKIGPKLDQDIEEIIRHDSNGDTGCVVMAPKGENRTT